MNVFRIVRFCTIAVVILSSFSTFPAVAYEDVPNISITEVVSPEDAQSVHHRIEEVNAEGNYLHFTIDSEFGIYRVPSLTLLRIRVEEIKILGEAIVQFERGKDALEELPGQLRVSAGSAMEIITNPLGTATDAAGQLARNINDTLSGVAVDMETERRYGYDRRAELDPSTLMHKRNIASQWRLDVYSTNPKVQEFLDTVARARSSGKIASGAPPLTTGSKRDKKAADPDIEIKLSGLFKDKTRDELHALNERLLKEMQIPEDVYTRFLQMPVYTPSQQTRITHYLNSLNGVINRTAFFEAAIEAETEQGACAAQESAMMLTHYHGRYGDIQKIHFGEILQAITEDDRVVSFMPIDITYWSSSTAGIFDGVLARARAAGYTGWELVSSGMLTQEARRQLGLRNFTIRDWFLN